MANRRRLNRYIPGVVAAVVFVVILAAWTLSGRTAKDDIHVNKPNASTSGPAGATGSSTGSSGSARAGSGSTSPGTDAGGFPTNLPLNGTNVVDVHGGAQHQVTIRATSDSSILRLLFYIRGGHPSSGRYTGVTSPVEVSTVGREGSSGPIAEVWMQSSLYAHTVTCSITVDGTVRATQTAKGPHNVAICIA